MREHFFHWNSLMPVVIVVLVMVPFQYTEAQAAIIYVDDGAPTGCTGTSWSNAYKYLQDALYDASSDDEIRVAQGTYKPDLDEGGNVTPFDSTESFMICLENMSVEEILTIRGCYRGAYDGPGDPNDRDIEAFETILSGDLRSNDQSDTFVNYEDNSRHVVRVGHGEGDSTIIDGFTIIAGAATHWGEHDWGGGMYTEGWGTLIITNCTFRDNLAREQGGGMFNNHLASPELSYCTFIHNRARLGGGMFNSGSDCNPTLTNCVFSDNIAYDMTGETAVHGGGMYNNISSPTLTNCTFSGNKAEEKATNSDASFGGGIRNIGKCSLELAYCTFTGNTARNGGGMCNRGEIDIETGDTLFCSPVLVNCWFINNEANDTENHEGKGGGMYNKLSRPKLVSCIFSDNKAQDNDGSGGHGGGMCNFSGSSTELVNCLFYDNLAYGIEGGFGGGICNSVSSSSNLVNCTFSNNFASQAGGIYIESGCSATITNCILWHDTANEIFLAIPDSLDLNFSDVENLPPGLIGTGNINEDPLFVDPDNDNYRLSSDSPCIDTGDTSAVPEDVTTDLDGNPRIVDGDGNDTAAVDMGAYELHSVASSKEGDPAFYVDFGEDTSIIAGGTYCWTLAPANFGFASANCPDADTFCVWAYSSGGSLITGIPSLDKCFVLETGYMWWQDICVTVPCGVSVCDYDTIIAIMTYCDASLSCRHDWTDLPECEDPNYYAGSPYYSADTLILHVVESPPGQYILQDSICYVEQGQTAAYVPFTICNGDACADPTVYDYCIYSTGHIGVGFPQAGSTSAVGGGECEDVYGVVDVGAADICDLDTLTIIAWDTASGTVYDTCVQIVHVVEPVPVPLFTTPIVTILAIAMILAAAVIIRRKAVSSV